MVVDVIFKICVRQDLVSKIELRRALNAVIMKTNKTLQIYLKRSVASRINIIRQNINFQKKRR